MSENSKPNWNDPWLWGGLILPTLVALCVLFSPIGSLLELLSFDLLYLVRPSPNPTTLSEVVILKMDEESCDALGQDPSQPWDRTVHAKLLHELTVRRARVVAFDVLFDKPSPDVGADEQFSAAIREHGRVVLAASVQSSKDFGRPSSSQLLPPTRIIGSNATWGVIELPDDYRSIRKQLNYVEYTNFAWQVSSALGKAPADRLATRWLNFYGPGGTLRSVSYHRALETNTLPQDFFADKVVFIGQSTLITAAGQNSDQHATPFSRWGGGPTSGVEIQATAFLNLVREDWLDKLSPATELLLVLLAGVLLGAWLPHVPPGTGAVIALAFAILVAAGAIWLTWGYHRWFPWLIISAVQTPLALGWSVLTYTKRLTQEKETLERDVALAESSGSLSALLRKDASRLNLTPPSLRSPQTVAVNEEPPPIPNHRLVRRIGRGSYGEVWLAQDEIGTYHAVKVVHQRSFSSPTPYEREFSGMQKFTPISRNHPGFVHVLHVGRNDPEGYFFYIMELGDDKLTHQQIDPATYAPNTLATLLEGGRLPLPVCVKLGLDLTAALDYLHQRQLVHRDIKPSNIIFVHHVPKFADVGLVTDISPAGRKATFIGTEGYIAPEGPGTPAADIYSLGKVLYEAYTGRDRLEFPSLSGTLVESGSREMTMLNDVILKACQSESKHRYQTASLMRTDLMTINQRMNEQR